MRTFVPVSVLLFIIVAGIGGFTIISLTSSELAVSANQSSFLSNVFGDSSEVRGGDWDRAVRTPQGNVFGISNASSLNVRSEATLTAEVTGTIHEGHPVQIVQQVQGDDVEGNSRWYELESGGYIASIYIDPFVPPTPEASYDGRWIDVNLSNYYGVAYDGDDPVYVAILRVGAAGTDTPEGEFSVSRRVETETMDSTTVGINEGDPDYYYLEDVKYTQYFREGGYAIHGNYWSEPWEFGGTGSQGCINLTEKDAAYFWNFLDYGSPVSVHY